VISFVPWPSPAVSGSPGILARVAPQQDVIGIDLTAFEDHSNPREVAPSTEDGAA
jgi:hypothetical protein